MANSGRDAGGVANDDRRNRPVVLRQVDALATACGLKVGQGRTDQASAEAHAVGHQHEILCSKKAIFYGPGALVVAGDNDEDRRP